MNTFYLLRGLPGSGKSTLARKIQTKTGAVHCEADMFFTDSDGNYKWDGVRIGQAHDWCWDQFTLALDNKQDVIVSNTFTRSSEMIFYLTQAGFDNYRIFVVECLNAYGSIHGVPEKSLEIMRARWIPNSVLKCLDRSGNSPWSNIVVTYMNSVEFENEYFPTTPA